MATMPLWERPRAMRNGPLAIVAIAILAQVATLVFMSGGGAWQLRRLGIASPTDEQIATYEQASIWSAWLVIAFAAVAGFAVWRTRFVHAPRPWIVAASWFGLWGMTALIGWGVPKLFPELGREILPWRVLHMDGPPFYLPLLISILLIGAIRQRIWTYELAGVISQFD